jgi:aspartyl protease family protein
MHPQQDRNIYICPHCGAENIRVPESWMSMMDDKDSWECTHCQKAIHGKSEVKSTGAAKPGFWTFGKKFLIIAGVLIGWMIFLNSTFDVLSFKEDTGRLLYEILIILFISWVLATGRLWKKFGYLAIWALIFLVLMIGYTYRHELSAAKGKVIAAFIPAKGFQKKPGSFSFPVSEDGHFYIRAEVNGIPITFLADTGASDIVLSPRDAEKLGMAPEQLDYDRFYETANGMVRGSAVRIADFRVGEIHLEQIGATVNQVPMRNSLLGMAFFGQLNGYEVRDDVLTLYWKR